MRTNGRREIRFLQFFSAFLSLSFTKYGSGAFSGHFSRGGGLMRIERWKGVFFANSKARISTAEESSGLFDMLHTFRQNRVDQLEQNTKKIIR